jgi:hypothetical protein
VTPFFGSSKPSEPLPSATDEGLLKKVPAAPRQRAVEAPQKRWRRFFFNGRRPEPLPSHMGTVEDPVPGKLGVCCSGGGIRSAAFSLGALQSLQEKGELRRASYLAAVSGGSYIAAAISMVAKTGRGNSDRDLIEAVPAFAKGSPEEQYLRNRCSYLAPTALDKLYLAMRVVLGLIVNLLFISLPLVGIALIATGLFYAPVLPELAGSATNHEADLPMWFCGLPLATLLVAALFGAATLLFRWREEEWERFFSSWSTRLLLLAALFGLLLVGVPYLVEWLRDFGGAGASADSVVDASSPLLAGSTLALLAGIAVQLAHFLRSKQAEETMARGRKAFARLGSAARLTLAYAAGALVGPLLLLLIFALAISSGMAETARPTSWPEWPLIGVGFAILVLFAGLYAFADLTTWSLHPYYKRRLGSAFALKRIGAENLTDDERDRLETVAPSPGGIAIERDYDKLVPISETALDTSKDDGAWPTLLVCAAANISDTAATPPGRTVTSFTFSAHAVGGPLVGAVEMRKLERAFEKRADNDRAAEAGMGERITDLVTARKHRRRDLALPSAVAISGAAVSPSMGKMTARPLRFLMALANVRLGVWLPNPRWVAANEEAALPSRLARPRPLYLLREMLGWNTVAAKYLYVTDGGHYENLGLVELLRRGCTEIYCFDASGVGSNGAQFGALGEAIALARSELGVEVEFEPGVDGRDPKQLLPDEKKPLAERDVVVGTIKYPPEDGKAGVKGKLVYVRNTMTAKAPMDVQAHHETDPRFPNNPTVDQLYTDQKFEAYRGLGEVAGANAIAALRGS